MIGSLDRSRKRAHVVGAGISGLLIADALDREGFEVTLLEASQRVGGLIQTRMTPFGPSEAAAHSLLGTPPVIHLLERLGVKYFESRARERFVWREERMRRLPLSARGLLTMFARAAFAREPQASDPSLSSWAKRHLGEEAAEWLISPMVAGIYGARAAELSVEAAFPRFALKESETLLLHALRTRRASPRAPMIAISGGMSALVGALERSLRERLRDRFRLGVPVTTLPETENLVLSVPARESARLLAPISPEASNALRGIQYAPLVSVTTFFEAAGSPRGVGVLFPEREKSEVLGILFNSSSYPGRARANHHSVTVMLGGTLKPEWVEASEQEISDAVSRALEKYLSIRAPLAHLEIWRHPAAIPIYSEDLRNAWRALQDTWCARPGRVLFGNYTGQVSIRGMVEQLGVITE